MFFDTLKNWDQFIPFLNTKETKDAIDMYFWWGSKKYVPTKSFLSQRLWFFDGRGITDEVKYILSKNPDSTDNPYWWCVPHDCVELNGILTAVIVKQLLKVGLDKIYNVTLKSDKWSPHVVISSEYVNSTNVNSGAFKNIVLYDLICPMLPIFDEYKKLKLECIHCQSVAQNWNEMGYIKYFETNQVF